MRRAVATGIALMFAASAAWAGPVDNGLAELNAAMAARNLKWKNKAELSLDAAESFRIEPYAYGGAYITGGDLRGLMYGLFEAAEQIRANGRFAKARGDRAAALRGVRIELDSNLERAPENFWRSYFQMLARNRFNRAHVVFPRLTRPYRSACVLSRAAADYAIDFTLGVGGEIGADEMGVLLAVCPTVRSVAVEPGSPSRNAVLDAVQHAGRLVTVDTDGNSGGAGSLDSPITVLRPSALWPPSFEIRAPMSSVDQTPAGQNMDPAHAADHAPFYWVWGRLSYDPKTKPPIGANAAEYEAAHIAALHISAAGLADEGGADHVASAMEAVRNVKQGMASAKFTPLDIARRLESAAAILEKSATPDFQAIAGLATERARQQRSAYARALREAESPEPPRADDPANSSHQAPGRANADHATTDHTTIDHTTADHTPVDHTNVFYANATSSAPSLARPQMMHKPYQAASSDQALPVTLRLVMSKQEPPKKEPPKKEPPKQAVPKQAAPQQLTPNQPTLVRLHYRTLDPQSRETVLEEPASPEVHFIIPGSDLTGTWDLFYYFEVLNAEGSGWFEPDPFGGAPYFTVHIQAPRTGPN